MEINTNPIDINTRFPIVTEPINKVPSAGNSVRISKAIGGIILLVGLAIVGLYLHFNKKPNKDDDIDKALTGT